MQRETTKPTIHHVGGGNTTPVVADPSGKASIRVNDQWLPTQPNQK